MKIWCHGACPPFFNRESKSAITLIPKGSAIACGLPRVFEILSGLCITVIPEINSFDFFDLDKVINLSSDFIIKSVT